MRNIFYITAAILIVSLAACGQEKQPEATSTKKQDLSKVGNDNIFKPQVDALQKAQNVQGELDKAAEEQRQAIDKQL